MSNTPEQPAAIESAICPPQSLADAADRIVAARPLTAALQVLADEARQSSGAHEALAFLFPVKSEASVQVWSRAEGGTKLGSIEHAACAELGALACQSRKSLRLSQTELGKHPAWRVPLSRPTPGGLLTVPLAGQDGLPVGFIQVLDKDGGEFNAEDATTLRLLATAAALAVENARLVHERHQTAQEHQGVLGREQAARNAAENAQRITDELVGTIAHELRTPMAAILSWIHTLRTGKLDAAATAHGLRVIERNVQAQAKLINDLMDHSRAALGKMGLHTQPLDPAGVIEAVVETLQPVAQTKKIQLQAALPHGLGLVMGDSDRLYQVFANLFSNALRFTPEGGRVEVRMERADGQIKVSVADSGRGIPPSFMGNLFQPFSQSVMPGGKHPTGLGLGLAIARELVEAHGGTISAQSPGEGQGATFIVCLPLLRFSAVGTTPPA